MTALLASTTATSPTATEGDVKTYLANMREFIADLLGTDSANKAAVQVLLGASLNGKLAKSGAYTVVPADRGKVIDCTGTWTLNFSAAATMGDGFVFAVRNFGSGAITIDPNLSETINGQSSLVIGNGSFYLIYCDGVGFSTVGASQAKGAQVFTAPGTFTIPTGVTALKVTVVGGGGGGSGCGWNGSSAYNGGGGGAGGSSIAYLTGLTPGQTLTVGAVGAGGAAGLGSNASSGGSGGTSSVSSGTQTIATISATGGGGGAGAKETGYFYGGSGGAGSGAALNLGGEGGGINEGGSSLFGGGARSGPSGSHGAAGAAFGAGGSGGNSGVAITNGGVGAAGVVIFEW